jgi:hypothetical protein
MAVIILLITTDKIKLSEMELQIMYIGVKNVLFRILTKQLIKDAETQVDRETDQLNQSAKNIITMMTS